MVRTKAGICILTAVLLAFVALPLVAYANEPAAEPLVEKHYDLTGLLSPYFLSQISGEAKAAAPKLPLADASQQVLDLIVTMVQPSSWQTTGTGLGTVAKVRNSHSVLVVHQTKVVHQEIADLLEQLDRLNQLQILYKVQELSCSSEDWQAFVKKHNYQREQPIVDAEMIETLLTQAQKKLAAQQSIAFNGEMLPLEIRSFAAKGKTQVLTTTGVVSAQFKFVRLTWSFDKLTEASPACDVPLQKSVLIELPGETGDNAPRSLAVLTPVILLRSNTARSELTPVTEPWPLR